MTLAPPLSLAAIRQPAFLYTPDGRIAAANDRIEALAGRPLAGCSAADIIAHFGHRHPDGRQFVPEELPPTRALAGEEAIDVPIEITAADGRTVHILATASPIRESGGIVGALVVWQDVSALETALAEQHRLRSEAEVRAQELWIHGEELRQQGEELGAQGQALAAANDELARQRLLLDTILGALPHRVSIWSSDERLVWANETFGVELHQPREALIGRTWREIGLAPDLFEPFMEEVRQVIATGAPSAREGRYPHSTGTQWRACTFVPFSATAALVVSENIDERKAMEQTLAESEADARSFMENLIDACAICETVHAPDGTPIDIRLVEVNAALARTLRRPAAAIVGRTAFEVLPELARPWFDRYLEVGRTGKAMEFEEPFPALGRWYRIAAFPVRGGRIAVLFRDITRRREAEAARQEYAERLRASNEELQRFAYVASHDLQEPLRSIVSFAQLLDRRYRGRLDREADEFLGFIVEGGNRMQALIRDLLQVSRVETEAKPLEPTDAAGVVTGALQLLEVPIREAGGAVQVDSLPRVMADAAQLELVFTNLIGNALKYRGPDVPPRVRISARRAGPSWWEFAVADNGIGIEAEYFDRIFEMFRRLHTHEEYDGTGIGLAIVKRIVERHGGTVWVESTPSEGSTFFFTLPSAPPLSNG